MNVNGLHGIIGDACINFMRKKPQPFGMQATKYQEIFWDVPTFKRALFGVFFLRYVLGYKSQKNWKKYLQADYKFNTRCFKRWEDLEVSIFQSSALYGKMPAARTVLDTIPRKKRGNVYSASDPFSSDSPMKRRFVVKDESTDSE